MTPETTPKQYVIQKKVMARSVAEALQKEADSPIESVFVDANQPEKAKADAIGFKTTPIPQ